MFRTLVHISKKLKPTQMLSADEQIKCGIFITMSYYSTIKRNKILIHATTWMNFKNMLRETSQMQKTTHMIT